MADLDKKIAIRELNLTLPLPMDPQNFTSLRRTPWAGVLLASGIKKRFAPHANARIGESWEVSCDPDAPSKIATHHHLTLPEIIAERTVECLSESLVSNGRNTCEILIKLLNASSPLSLQIHPRDDNHLLRQNECGKPESWLVLAAEPGSGLYLGFNHNIGKEELEGKLLSGTFDASLLQFVPVRPGDYFDIAPHVPHAIGPGVVLLEPQRIIAGKSGKTWRLWDWNRKYNAEGVEDPAHGKPRELNIRESMQILNPAEQNGERYVNSLRRSPRSLVISANSTIRIFPANTWYQTILVDLGDLATIRLLAKAKYACVTVIKGALKSTRPDGSSTLLRQGESYFFGNASLPTEWANADSQTQVSLVIPAGIGVEDHQGLIFQF